MSLRLMREKGILTQAEYDSAVRDLAETSGKRTAEKESIVIGKWATTLYGFIESDMIFDTTRSFSAEAPGGTPIARAGTPSSPSPAGDNGRFIFGARGSRLGIRVKAPEFQQMRASATLESDFLGNQPGVQTGPYPATPLPTNPYISEGAFFTNPTFRIRHAHFKVETPVVDVLFGQYWQLFGWQAAYAPNTVEIQGVPGVINARSPQLRISKTIKAGPVTFEAAVAASRPVQRDNAFPDGQAGLRLAIDTWTGAQTVGSTGTQTSPLSIAVTGLVRQVTLNQWSSSTSKYTSSLALSAIAVDGFVPVVPATKNKKDNALSLNGEFATGYGYADMYTSTNFGVGFLAPPGTGITTTLPAGMTSGPLKTTYYSPNIDAGIVTYDASGNLHGVELLAYLFGAQYYLPGVDGKVWISGNYSHQESVNSFRYSPGNSTLAAIDWFDVNLFVDPLPSIRVGAEYANTTDTYVDGIKSVNHRGQVSGFFLF